MNKSQPGKELESGSDIANRKSSVDKGLERDPDLLAELPVVQPG